MNEKLISQMTDGELDAAVEIEAFDCKELSAEMLGRGYKPQPYSTDPVASKTLRDKMRADGWGWTLAGDDDTAVLNAEFYGPFGDEESEAFQVVASTEERAVAEAALLAIRSTK